jgi:hypothetical protein
MRLETRIERESGYALERRGDAAKEQRAQRIRPRLAGSVALPPDATTAAEMFLVSLEDLAAEERSTAGWCLRIGVPEVIPSDAEYDVHELVAELTTTVDGMAYTLEANAFPGFTLHLPGEQVSGRLKWGAGPVVVPPAASCRWQLSRGDCQTRASRAFTVQAVTAGIVPAFATAFALFSGADAIAEDIQLDFATHTGAARVIQHFTKNDLLQAVGTFVSLPPGASAWRWLTASAKPLRLAFSLGPEQLL